MECQEDVQLVGKVYEEEQLMLIVTRLIPVLFLDGLLGRFNNVLSKC